MGSPGDGAWPVAFVVTGGGDVIFRISNLRHIAHIVVAVAGRGGIGCAPPHGDVGFTSVVIVNGVDPLATPKVNQATFESVYL